MKFNFKKVLAATLVCAGILSMSACDKETKNLVDVESPENSDVVMTIGTQDVTYDEYRYFYLNSKRDLDGGDEAYWTENPDAEATLKETVLETLIDFKTIYNVAADNKVVVTEEDMASLDSQVQSMVEMYGEEEFNTMLTDAYFTDVDFYASVYSTNFLETNLIKKLAEDGKLGIDLEAKKAEVMGDDYVRAMHILYSDEAKAKEVLEQAKSATDEEFYELAQAAEDPGMIGNTDGYYFTYGAMIEEFEDATFALEVGQTSDLVSGPYGYHIIRKLEKDEKYVEEHILELTANEEMYNAYYAYLDGFADTYRENIVYAPAYESLNNSTVK